jgi:hypothetical protein
MKSEKMWEKLAKYYDAQYTWKNYKKESIMINGIINDLCESKGKYFLICSIR